MSEVMLEAQYFLLGVLVGMWLMILNESRGKN